MARDFVDGEIDSTAAETCPRDVLLVVWTPRSIRIRSIKGRKIAIRRLCAWLMFAKVELHSGAPLPQVRSDGSFELRLRCWVRFWRALLSELKSKVGLPWRQRLAAWRSGFSSQSWVVYDLQRNDPSLYVSDISSALRFYEINGFFNAVMGDKLVLSHLLGSLGLPHPEVVAILDRGCLVEPGDLASRDIESVLLRTLDRYPRQVFRPTWSGGGEGVFFVSKTDDGLSLNGSVVGVGDLCHRLAGLDRYIVTAFVDQAEYAHRIFPGSSNTLRVLTLWDDDRGEPYVAAVVQRLGSSRSAPIDNWHQGRGGLCAEIDAEASTLGRAVMLSADNRLEWLHAHPETGERITGVEVPHLRSCLDGLLSVVARLPQARCVGWDVLITDDGFRILEANSPPGLWVWQVHQPLLADPRTRSFFRRWGVVG